MLLGLVARPGEPHIILTQRTAHLRDHAGQISLPGGRIEPDDDGPAAAALREALEEIGLEPAKVELLGGLRHYDTITGFRIHPIVGWIEPPVELTPDPYEVAEVFELPLSFALDPAQPPPRQLRAQRRASGTSTCCPTRTATSGVRPPASWSTSPGCSRTEALARILLEVVLPFLAPFAAYAAYRLLVTRGRALPRSHALVRAHRRRAGAGLRSAWRRWPSSAVRRPAARYVPPRIENGRIVPGQVRPPVSRAASTASRHPGSARARSRGCMRRAGRRRQPGAVRRRLRARRPARSPGAEPPTSTSPRPSGRSG